MLRPTLIVTAAALLCSVGTAQRKLTESDIRPVTGPVQHAGIFDWQQKRWVNPGLEAQVRAGSLIVYDNTCTFTGAQYYFATASCVDNIMDGRIPGGIGNANNPLGSTSDNLINFFEFSYCTTLATGAVDVKVGFYDSLGGTCVGATSPTPPSLASQAQGFFDFGAGAGFPLPGSPAGGLVCNIIGVTNFGFCMQSDADGFFDNVAALDNFNWSFQFENTTGTNGMLLKGEPGQSPVGGCTYNIPCGTQFVGGAPCGHGLGQDDAWWMNVDGDPAGDTINTGAVCTGVPPGTNCYWFGGHPANPYAGFHLKLGSAGECAGCDGDPVPYCTPTTACASTMSIASGVPSAKAQNPCIIQIDNTIGQRNGLIFFGLTTTSAAWNLQSTLCVKAPTQRTGLQTSTGTSGVCDGTLSTDVNALIAAGNGTLIGQQLYAGSVVYGQAWYRDSNAVKTSNMSQALEFTLCP